MKKLISKHTPIDKLIIQFEYANEWQDLVVGLNRFNKILKQYKVSDLPDRLVLGRWLTNCFSPSLPNGLHLKALETVKMILDGEQEDSELIDNFTTFGVGLCRLFSKATLLVKINILGIFGSIILRMEGNSPVISLHETIIVSIMTDLDEYSQEYEPSVKTLRQCLNCVGSDYFYSQLWGIIYSFPDVRIGALRFIIEHYSVEFYSVKSNNSLMIESLVLCLVTPDVSVRRLTVDLLNIALPISMLCTNLPQYAEKILHMVMMNLLSKDSQLIRRVIRWLIEPLQVEDQTCVPNYHSYVVDSVESLLLMDCNHLLDDCEDIRNVCPFRVVIGLCDRCYYFRKKPTVDVIFPSILSYLSKHNKSVNIKSNDIPAKLLRQFSDYVSVRYILKYFIQQLQVNDVTSENLMIFEFVLPLLDFYEKGAFYFMVQLFGCFVKQLRRTTENKILILRLINNTFSVVMDLYAYQSKTNVYIDLRNFATQFYLFFTIVHKGLSHSKISNVSTWSGKNLAIKSYSNVSISRRLKYRIFNDDMSVDVFSKYEMNYLVELIVNLWGIFEDTCVSCEAVCDDYLSNFTSFLLTDEILDVNIIVFGVNRVTTCFLQLFLMSAKTSKGMTFEVIMNFVNSLKTTVNTLSKKLDCFTRGLISLELSHSNLLMDLIDYFWSRIDFEPSYFIQMALSPTVSPVVVRFILFKFNSHVLKVKRSAIDGFMGLIKLVFERHVNSEQRFQFTIVFDRIIMLLMDEIIANIDCELRTVLVTFVDNSLRLGYVEIIATLLSPLLLIDTERYCQVEQMEDEFISIESLAGSENYAVNGDVLHEITSSTMSTEKDDIISGIIDDIIENCINEVFESECFTIPLSLEDSSHEETEESNPFITSPKFYKFLYDFSRAQQTFRRLLVCLQSLKISTVSVLYSSNFNVLLYEEPNVFKILGISDLRSLTFLEAMVELIMSYINSDYSECGENDRIDNIKVQMSAAVCLRAVLLLFKQIIDHSLSPKSYISAASRRIFSTLKIDFVISERISFLVKSSSYSPLEVTHHRTHLELYEAIISLKNSFSSLHLSNFIVLSRFHAMEFTNHFESLPNTPNDELFDCWMHFLVVMSNVSPQLNAIISPRAISVICNQIKYICDQVGSHLTSAVNSVSIRNFLTYLQIFCGQTVHLEPTSCQCSSNMKQTTPSWDKFVTLMNPVNWIYKSKKNSYEFNCCPHVTSKMKAIEGLPVVLDCCSSVLSLKVSDQIEQKVINLTEKFRNIKEVSGVIFVDIFIHIPREVITTTIMMWKNCSYPNELDKIIKLYHFASSTSFSLKPDVVVCSLTTFVREVVMIPGTSIIGDVGMLSICVDFMNKFFKGTDDTSLIAAVAQVVEFLRLFANYDSYSPTSSPSQNCKLGLVFSLHSFFTDFVRRILISSSSSIIDKRLISRLQDFYQRSLSKALSGVLVSNCLRFTNYVFKTYNLLKLEDFTEGSLTAISTCERVLSVMCRELVVVLDYLFLSRNTDRAINITSELLTFVVPFIYSPQEYISCRVAAVRLLSQICMYQPLKRGWKKQILGIFMDSGFATLDDLTMSHFLSIADNLGLNDNSVIRDLIDRALPWGYQNTVNLFVNHVIDSKSASNAVQMLFRISFLIFAAENNQFSCFIPELQKRLHEVFGITSGPTIQIQSAAFLLIRTLLLKISSQYLTIVLNLALFESKRVISDVVIGENEIMDFSVEKSYLILNVCKLVNTIYLLPHPNRPSFQFKHIFDGLFISQSGPVHPRECDKGTLPLLNLNKIKNIDDFSEFLNVMGGEHPRRGNDFWLFYKEECLMKDLLLILKADLLSFQL